MVERASTLQAVLHTEVPTSVPEVLCFPGHIALSIQGAIRWGLLGCPARERGYAGVRGCGRTGSLILLYRLGQVREQHARHPVPQPCALACDATEQTSTLSSCSRSVYLGKYMRVVFSSCFLLCCCGQMAFPCYSTGAQPGCACMHSSASITIFLCYTVHAACPSLLQRTPSGSISCTSHLHTQASEGRLCSPHLRRGAPGEGRCGVGVQGVRDPNAQHSVQGPR